MTNVTLTTEQAQQIEEALDKLNSVYGLHETPCVAKALATIRAARAREQEPVAANCPKCKSEISHWSWCPDFVQPVSQKQKPVAYMVKSEGFIYSLVNRISAAEEIVSMLRKDDQGAAIHPLYAAPVQQVDLTDEELEALHDRHAGGWPVLFRAVVAAYNEKNK